MRPAPLSLTAVEGDYIIKAVVKKALLWLFALSLPIFLLTTNIRLAANSLPLYNYGFKTFKASEKLNLTPKETTEIGKNLIRFFNSPKSRVEETEPYPGFFNQKEKIHLQDIKNLIKLDYLIWKASGLTLIVLALALLLLQPILLPQALLRGSILTLGIFLVLLPLLFLAFDRLFLLFHIISFPNTYWMMDPAQDKLIVLFPPQFFYRATIFITLGVMAEALLVGGLGWFIRHRWTGSWKGSRRSS